MADGCLINIAIDDYEHKGVITICDEIFGNENFISNVVVQHNPRGRNDDKFYGTSHEYMIVYSNNYNNANLRNFKLTDEDIAIFRLTDEISAYQEVSFMRTGNNSDRHTRPNLFYPIYLDLETNKLTLEQPLNDFIEALPINPSGEEKTWRWERKTFDERKDTEISFKITDGKLRLYKKRRPIDEGKKPKTVWYDSKYDASSHGIMFVRNLFSKQNQEFSYPKSINTVSDAVYISSGKNSLILDYFAGSGTTAHAVINLNREDNGNRQYILVEQGEYFDTVLKPRVQKVIYSKAWKEGKPVVEDGAENLQGVPQIVKVLKLESYEDTLNNLELRRSGLFDHLPENAQQDYLLNYMLNLESRGSLLNVSHFEKPFDYGLNISTTSAGAYEWQKVDLVETFNYLIGAKVIHVDDKRAEQGFVAIECRLPNQSEDEKTLIFWRDCERVDYDGLQTQFDRLGINPADSEYSQVYVNGDHTLETVWDGEQSGSLKIISIEDAFLSLMFEGDA